MKFSPGLFIEVFLIAGTLFQGKSAKLIREYELCEVLHVHCTTFGVTFIFQVMVKQV